jgi:chorismate-pyruvate lyase
MILVATLCGTACAQDWPDTDVARVTALAELQTLNAELLSHDSATSTLERWCDAHHLATPPQVIAERSGEQRPATAQQRRELQVSASEAVRYRHVKLRCGTIELSEADNWYVPARLTADMNRVLDSSDTPFGKVVQALHFQRHTIESSLLWQPLPAGWDMQPPPARRAPSVLRIPAAVLQHRAVLTLPDGTPFSEVVETYSRSVLAFPAPRH